MANLHIVILVFVFISESKTSNPSPTAQTQQGIYIGQQITINGTNVNYWYGIPYAQQPIDELRWKPPQALSISNGTKEAYIPTYCPQGSGSAMLVNESCLTLNVYAPENASHLPVFIWIHGGSFTGGTGTIYNASQFVSTSVSHSIAVVVVTINYRLGLLGFLADEALYEERSGINNRSTTGNYGMLDQMMALDWIKKNIAGFGGDPEQMTIGGESAGGISVTILLTSPLVASGTFQRAIVESGNIWPNYVSILQQAINDSGHVLRAMTHCTTVQCLRRLPVEQILTVQATIASKNIFGVAACPVIDGYVLDDIMENNYARGKFQKVPIMVGSTTNETTLFTCSLFHGTATVPQVQAFFNTIYNTSIVGEIPSIYGPISAYKNPLFYLNTVYSDSWAHCGSRRIVAEFSNHGVPSYLYTYDHLISVAPLCYGVAHGAELAMLFPELLPYLYPNYNLTALEQQLSTSMMLYWAHFIHTSNPSFTGNPANWDAYQISTDGDFVLDINPRMRTHYYVPTCSRFWDQYAVTNNSIILSAP